MELNELLEGMDRSDRRDKEEVFLILSPDYVL